MNRAVIFWLICCIPAHADLKFQALRKEVTAVPEGGILKVEFPFKNEGEDPVTISRYDSGCGCLAGKIEGNKNTYRPDETGKVIVEIDTTNLYGVVEKQLDIWVAGKTDKPTATLAVQVTVPELIQLEPRTLKWNASELGRSKTITVTMNSSSPIHVTGTDGDDDKITRVIKVLEDGKKYEVTVTPLAGAQIGAASFRIGTDCPIERLRSKVAFLVISGSLQK